MPERSYSSPDYRYGFNRQEKDNEVDGSGNTNTAAYWEYDTRLGRRWNLDPEPQIRVSDYACFGNNPIFYIDVNGNTIGGPEGDKVKAYAQGLSQRVQKLNTEIVKNMDEIKDLNKKLNSQISSKAKNKINKKIDRLNKVNAELVNKRDKTQDQVDEIGEMEKNKTILYYFGTKSGKGDTRWNGTEKRMDVLFNPLHIGSFEHELKHAFQFEKGQMAYFANGKGVTLINDIADEQEAYLREWEAGQMEVIDFSTAASIRSVDPGSYGNLIDFGYNRSISNSATQADIDALKGTLSRLFTQTDDKFQALLGKPLKDLFDFYNKQATPEFRIIYNNK